MNSLGKHNKQNYTDYWDIINEEFLLAEDVVDNLTQEGLEAWERAISKEKNRKKRIQMLEHLNMIGFEDGANTILNSRFAAKSQCVDCKKIDVATFLLESTGEILCPKCFDAR